jgi:type IV pilus assembly protein PilM
MPIGLFGRRAKSMVGLDIGTSRVKLVELTAKGASIELTRAAVELTPVDVIRDGKVVQPEQVAAVIKKALAAGHIRPGEVVAAIAGQGVVVRHVQFPKMPEEELREALKWEGQKYIPFPMEEAVVDFELIHGVADPEVASMEVMLVAAQRSIVDSHLAAIELAGLRVVAVDVQPFTVLRALRYEPPGAVRPPTAGNGIVAYVDIGAGTTDIVIAEGEILRFTRIVPVGGYSFTRAIADGLGVGFEEAEQIKIDQARVYQDQSQLGMLDARSRAIAEAVLGTAREIGTEVRRSLDYHDLQLQGRRDDAAVSRVVLAGGGSVLDGLDQYLQGELGLPTTMCDPLRNISISPKVAAKLDLAKLGPMLAVGIGLALREVVD